MFSNNKLAKKVAQHFGCALGGIFFDRFADGEILVKTLSDVTNKDVIIIESTATKAHERLFELLLLIDSIKRSGANSVKLYIPYLGYSRQERVSWINEPVSCEVVAKILDTAQVDEILTFDLHHNIIETFFKTPFKSLSTTTLFADYYKKLFSEKGVSLEDVIVVSPDHGSNERADSLAGELPGSRKVILEKYRPRPNLAEHLKVDCKTVQGKHCVIIDDIVDTGGTVISAANLLIENGAVEVYVAASHAVFSGDSIEQLLSSSISDVVVTNTIEKKLPKEISVVDIYSLVEK